MSFISLTSDFGIKDGNVARVKAKILSGNAQAHIIDISHQINPFDIGETAFVMQNCIYDFPENSIHLALVDTFDHPYQKGICAQIGNQFILSNDNGLVSLLAKEDDEMQVRVIDDESENRENILISAVVKLDENPSNFYTLGALIEPKEFISLRPISKENQITGVVVYVDTYGNAITNISKALFEQVGKNRSFEINARNYSFTKILNSYYQVVPRPELENQFYGEKMALWNDRNLLEIAMYKSNNNSVGGASQLLGLQREERILINFTE